MKTSNTAHLGQLTEFFIEFLLFIYGLPTLKHMKRIIGVGVKFTFLLHGLERKTKGFIVGSLQILAVATVILELH
jgi:hypothetical protein